MMQQIANFIVDHDPMMVLQRTHDTVRYIRWAWNKDHADPIDEDGLRLFLCDEHRGDLTDEQKTLARRCRDEMRSVYEELCVRLLQSEIMLEQGMVPDISTYRSVFCPEGVMRRGCLTGRDNRKSDRFAVDEREAGESPDAFLRQGEPQLPAVRAVSGLSIDAVLPWETIR